MVDEIADALERWHEEGYSCLVVILGGDGEDEVVRMFSTIEPPNVLNLALGVAKVLATLLKGGGATDDGALLVKGAGGTEEMVGDMTARLRGDAVVVAGLTDESCSVYVRGSVADLMYACMRVTVTMEKVDPAVSLRDGLSMN